MLAERRSIKLAGVEVGRTPLVVPSFSSKGFPDVRKIIETLKEVISGCLLISAYDLHYKLISSDLSFGELVFLDSGGYECTKDKELSDLGYVDHVPQGWSQDNHRAVLDGWKVVPPTVAVSYDHPQERLPIAEQIKRATKLFEGRNVVKELLIKPESKTHTRIQIDSVIANVHHLADFDIIGFTEKELGYSLFKRMEHIARVRGALTKLGLHTPIHIFGSLDTISTPHYFLAGADIFDGLTWLRYAYWNGQAIYTHDFASLQIGSRINDELVPARIWFNNYYQLQNLELDMRRFIAERDFGAFKYHGDLLKRSHQEMLAQEDGGS